MKKIFIIPAIFFLSLAGLTLFKDLILRSVVAGITSSIVGAPVRMKTLSFSLIKSTIHITGFEIGNPVGFPKGILASVPTIKVAYDRAALFKRKLHILLAEIDLKELGLIKNREGLLNVDSLKIVKQQRERPKNSYLESFEIDLLTLGIGKIVRKDYTRGEEPVVEVRDMNIHKSYTNITSAEQLVTLILVEPMKAAGIQIAAIYGTALLGGVAVLPVAAVFTFTGKDSVEQSVKENFGHVYAISEKAMSRMGTITGHDPARGEIRADINGANVVLNLWKQRDGKTGITISARKFMFPQPDVAGGVLYQIVEKL